MKAELLRERYERLEIAGRGGEAEVIRALDHLHGRQVPWRWDDGTETLTTPPEHPAHGIG